MHILATETSTMAEWGEKKDQIPAWIPVIKSYQNAHPISLHVKGNKPDIKPERNSVLCLQPSLRKHYSGVTQQKSSHLTQWDPQMLLYNDKGYILLI